MTHSFPSRRSSDLLGGGAAGTGRGEDAVEGLLDAGADRRPRRRPLLARGRPDDRSATVHRRRLDSAVAAGAVATAVPPTPFVTLGLDPRVQGKRRSGRSEEHTSELQSLMRISYAVFCLKNKKQLQ